MGEVMHVVGHESVIEDQDPTTLELKEYGYLALARCLGSDYYEAPELSNQASGGLEILIMQNGALDSGFEDDFGGLRQSSMDMEPYTLDISAVREAKDIAIGIVETYDADDALHLFLKDAEDEQLRKEAMAAVLPTSEFAVLS